jgi:hypothetical protein
VQRLGHLERVDLAGRPVDGPVADEQASIEQHPNRLDRVQRDALGPLEDAVAQRHRQTGHEPLEQLLHRVLRERLQIPGGDAAPAGSPGRSPLQQLRPRQRDHEQRVVARPLQEVLDEVQQARVRPLQVLEHQHGRIHVGEALEEQAPGGEHLLPVTRVEVAESEQLRQARLDEAPVIGVRQVLVQRRPQLAERRLGRLVLGDPATHPHHVRQRPVGDPLPVGQTAAAVPEHRLDDAVEVLVELPRQPRLADPGDPRHRDQVRLPLLGAGVVEILDLAQLAVAADERRLQALRAERAAHPREHAQRPPERRLALLALQLEGARRLEGDRLLGRPPRRLPDVHRAGPGHRLDARGRVHQVARHHPLALGPDRHRRLAGQHTGPRPQLGRAHLVAERRHGRHEIQCRPHRSLRVVLGRNRRPPDGHHGVADELLHRSAVEPDEPPARLEVAREELAHGLRVAGLRQRREADEVGEEDGDETPLRGRRLARSGRRRPGGSRCSVERRAALPAEANARLVGGAARRAGARERSAAAAAELPAGAVLGPAVRTDHRHRRSLSRSDAEHSPRDGWL